ncbi:MAG: DUF1330 domain-containing protein [Burkholderiales bacterium]
MASVVWVPAWGQAGPDHRALGCRIPRQFLGGVEAAGELRVLAVVSPSRLPGARYLARAGAHKVHEGDWAPRRIVILEFPSVAAWEAFYTGSIYQGLKSIRDACSSARLVSVEGLSP